MPGVLASPRAAGLMRLPILLLCSGAVSATSRAAGAQAQTVFDGAPPASWIAPPGIPGDSFVVFHARRTFDLPARPERFIVHVSADNRYRLFVNGVSVCDLSAEKVDVTYLIVKDVLNPDFDPNTVERASEWATRGAGDASDETRVP